jgi:hypothetical protein
VFISKRKLIISGVVAVILAGVIGFGFAFAFAHTNQASKQDTTQTATQTAVAPVTSVTTGQRACVLGVVQSLSNLSFVVSANQGSRMVTITVNDQTMFAKRGSQASFSFENLAVGDKVRVTAQGQCNRKDTAVLAQSVMILTATGNPGVIPMNSPTP